MSAGSAGKPGISYDGTIYTVPNNVDLSDITERCEGFKDGDIRFFEAEDAR